MNDQLLVGRVPEALVELVDEGTLLDCGSADRSLWNWQCEEGRRAGPAAVGPARKFDND